MEIKIDITNTGLLQSQMAEGKAAAQTAAEEILSQPGDMTGWVGQALARNDGDLARILETARYIGKQCELFILIGIGGSCWGAKAAIEALPKGQDNPQVRFAGTNLSAAYHQEILREMERREVCLCAISKSGTTIETQAVYHIFKEAMMKKYGTTEAKRRIYTITDPTKGFLRQETDAEGYVNFTIPHDVAGRYSALTAAGLLPAAVAGVDISQMLQGVQALTQAGGTSLITAPLWTAAMEYALARYCLYQGGKSVEIFQYHQPSLQSFAEWLKQLFAESEGKEGKGLLPVSASLTTDLHSLGQFLQDGSPIFFETLLDIQSTEKDIPIQSGSLQGKTLEQLNRAATQAAMAAHKKAQRPCIYIQIPTLSPYAYGQLIYFFQAACAISAKLLGVNPFDQPGVEAYKKEMKKQIS